MFATANLSAVRRTQQAQATMSHRTRNFCPIVLFNDASSGDHLILQQQQQQRAVSSLPFSHNHQGRPVLPPLEPLSPLLSTVSAFSPIEATTPTMSAACFDPPRFSPYLRSPSVTYRHDNSNGRWKRHSTTIINLRSMERKRSQPNLVGQYANDSNDDCFDSNLTDIIDTATPSTSSTAMNNSIDNSDNVTDTSSEPMRSPQLSKQTTKQQQRAKGKGKSKKITKVAPSAINKNQTAAASKTAIVINKGNQDSTPSAALNNSGKKRRENLPKVATAILIDWLKQHRDHPYPTEEQKHELHIETQLGIVQISNWFINARRRILHKLEPSPTPETTTEKQTASNVESSITTGLISPTTPSPSTSMATGEHSPPTTGKRSALSSKQAARKAKAATAEEGKLRKTASPRITRSTRKANHLR